MKKIIIYMMMACLMANANQIKAGKFGDFCNNNPGTAAICGVAGAAALIGGSLLLKAIEVKRSRDPKVQKSRLEKIKAQQSKAYEFLKSQHDKGNMKSLSYWRLGSFFSGLKVQFKDQGFVKASYGWANRIRRSEGSDVAVAITSNPHQGKRIWLADKFLVVDKGDKRIKELGSVNAAEGEPDSDEPGAPAAPPVIPPARVPANRAAQAQRDKEEREAEREAARAERLGERAARNEKRAKRRGGFRRARPAPIVTKLGAAALAVAAHEDSLSTPSSLPSLSPASSPSPVSPISPPSPASPVSPPSPQSPRGFGVRVVVGSSRGLIEEGQL